MAWPLQIPAVAVTKAPGPFRLPHPVQPYSGTPAPSPLDSAASLLVLETASAGATRIHAHAVDELVSHPIHYVDQLHPDHRYDRDHAIQRNLARATLRYVEATDKGLALAREEFEREWSPDLHIKMERVSSTETRLLVTNLAKTSVLLQLLQLRKLSHATPFERVRLNDPLVGGLTWQHEMGRRILACTGLEFEGPIAASMTFYAAGRMFRTDWFRSQIVVRDGRIVSLEPSNMPARRVRVIERKGPERRREFVQDVTASVAPVKLRAKPDENFFVTGA
ncbi:MAG TPA: hypothetical protein VGM18_00865 [Candidatus Sulfotelmatobacter sp.]